MGDLEQLLQSIPKGASPELAFTGAELHAQDPQLVDAWMAEARVAVRRGILGGIRILATPETVLRSNLRQWIHIGITSVEILGWSLHPAALRRLEVSWTRTRLLDSIRALDGHGMVAGLHLLVGAPGTDHSEEIASIECLRASGLAFARLLPRLVLAEQDSAVVRPLSLTEAVHRSADLCAGLESLGVKVARLGLQPRVDLLESPEVAGGPYHASLRTLVETLRWRRRAEALMTNAALVGGEVLLRCHPADEGNLRGFESSNVRALRARFRLTRLGIHSDPIMDRGSLELERATALERVGQS